MNYIRLGKAALIVLFVVLILWLTKDWTDADILQVIYQPYLLGIFGLVGLDYWENRVVERPLKHAAGIAFVVCLISLGFVPHRIPLIDVSAGFLFATLSLAGLLLVFFQVFGATSVGSAQTSD